MKHEDYCTHISNKEDKPYLTVPLFNVVIRLFKTSEHYRNIVSHAIAYLKWWCVTPKEGYKQPHGVSGANAGIPFNIIAYNTDDGPIAMINPVIHKRYGKEIISYSNCGSLTLPEPIKIKRYEFIDISWYDEKGEYHIKNKVSRREGGLTIQHEVDHNIGVLITDHQIP